jgi:hypothetical protein
MENNKRIRNQEGYSNSYNNDGNDGNTKLKRNDSIRGGSRSDSSTVYDNRSRERDNSKELKELFVGK